MSQITNNKKFYINKCIIDIESNAKLKGTNNKNRACYYFHVIIKFEDFDFDNILIDENSNQNVLVYETFFVFIYAKLLNLAY